MPKVLSLLVCLPLLAAAQLVQITSGSIQAIGSATIPVTPDQVQLDVGVVTQGATAQDAGQQNATLTTTVLNALKGVLGAAGTIQTIGYSVSPRYSTTQGQPSVIIGYTASNTVEVTSTDLSLIGRLIDTAKQAQAHVNAIAAGLGAKTGTVISALEGASVTPIVTATPGVATATTPIQSGTVKVTANVTISVRLLQ